MGKSTHFRMDDPRTSEYTKFMYSLLTDEWQPLESILVKTGKQVPPGRAIRRNDEAQRSYQKGRGANVKNRFPELTREEKIARGRRNYAHQCLRTLSGPKSAGYAERAEIDGVQMIRLNSTCPACGRRAADAPTEQAELQVEQKPVRPPIQSRDEIRAEAFEEARRVVAEARRQLLLDSRGPVQTFADPPLALVEKALINKSTERTTGNLS